MKKIRLGKHVARIIPFMVLVLCLLAIPGAKPAAAAAKNYMKKLKGISWDLKTNGKWNTYQTKFAGIGMHTQKAKITKWKNKMTVTDAKVLTFRVTFNPQWKMSKSQIHKMVKSSYYKKAGNIAGTFGYYIVDYNTGENLEVIGNSAGVEVVDDGWHVQKTKTYRDNDGCSISLNTYYKDVTVTYYPGTELAVGIAGSTSLGQTSANNKFVEGKKLFGKTTYYSKKNKKIAHFKRVK